jgi:hypothetical protein
MNMVRVIEAEAEHVVGAVSHHYAGLIGFCPERQTDAVLTRGCSSTLRWAHFWKGETMLREEWVPGDAYVYSNSLASLRK